MLDFKHPIFWTRKCRLNFYLVSKRKFENSQKIGFREKVKIYLWTATSGILSLAPRVENPPTEVARVWQSCSVEFYYSWLFSVLGVGPLNEAPLTYQLKPSTLWCGAEWRVQSQPCYCGALRNCLVPHCFVCPLSHVQLCYVDNVVIRKVKGCFSSVSVSTLVPERKKVFQPPILNQWSSVEALSRKASLSIFSQHLLCLWLGPQIPELVFILKNNSPYWTREKFAYYTLNYNCDDQ